MGVGGVSVRASRGRSALLSCDAPMMAGARADGASAGADADASASASASADANANVNANLEAVEVEASLGTEEVVRDADERARVLGFRPQKEILYNRLLPYHQQLDAESESLLKRIRTNLGRAVVLRELKPGAAVWTARLIKYDPPHPPHPLTHPPHSRFHHLCHRLCKSSSTVNRRRPSVNSPIRRPSDHEYQLLLDSSSFNSRS